MELTVHITYFPMEAQYGASLWQGDSMVDLDYQLYGKKSYAVHAGDRLKRDYLKQMELDRVTE